MFWLGVRYGSRLGLELGLGLHLTLVLSIGAIVAGPNVVLSQNERFSWARFTSSLTQIIQVHYTGCPHWSVFLYWHRSIGFPNTPHERPFPTQFFPHRSQKSSKIWNDCVSRNGHRIKITQPNSMILVSFSSADDALFNDVKNMTLLDRRVLKIRCSAFLGHPV